MKKILITILCSIGLSFSAQAETIGISMARLDENFQAILFKKMNEDVAKKPEITLRSEDAQGDISRQQSQIENLIASGVDGLVVMLIDADSGAAISKMAENSNIPLIFINNAPTNVDQLPKGQAYVGSNEVEAGLLQADFLCKTFVGEGRAVVLQGLLGTAGQRGRVKGFHDGLAKEGCDRIKIVEEQTANWSRTTAMDLMSNWLSAGFKFNIVVANNDEMAIGAIQAMKAAGATLDDVVILGVDGTADGLSSITAGELTATMFQNAQAQADQSIEAVQKLIKGEDVAQKIYIPFELITKENIQSYLNRN